MRLRKILSAGGQVPTQTVAPASTSAFVIANPYPPSSATPATSARRPVRSILSMADDAVAAPESVGRVGLAGAVAPVRPGPSFARGLWRIAAADVSSGNAVRLLRDGAETFEIWRELIASARESIAVEQYIFHGDDAGRRAVDALGAAVDRGVAVRVLVDWIGRLGTRGSLFQGLRDRGAEVRVFSPPGFRPWGGLVPRDHRKLLVVDGAVGVTGGIGIGNEWRTG